MDNIFQFLGKFDEYFKSIYILLAIISVWTYFYYKSGSIYTILDKVWSLFVGQKEYNNKVISKFNKERHDIDKFNSIYNVDAINTNEIVKFTKWIADNNYDIRKISNVKSWFKISELKLTRPNSYSTFGLSLIAIVLFLSSLILGIWGTTPHAIVKINDNDPWISINLQRAKTLSSDYVISREDCKRQDFNRGNYARLTNLEINSVNAICDGFLVKKESEAIKQIIKGQRVLLYISFATIIISLLLFRAILYRLNAIDFHYRYIKNKKP